MQRCRSFFAMKAIANLSWVFREHRAICRLSPAFLLARRNQSPDAVRSRNPSKSTLAHDAVAAAVLHKHHPIICVGAGLIQFVYRSHSRLVTEFTRHRTAFSPFFAHVFKLVLPNWTVAKMRLFLPFLLIRTFFSSTHDSSTVFLHTIRMRVSRREKLFDFKSRINMYLPRWQDRFCTVEI